MPALRLNSAAYSYQPIAGNPTLTHIRKPAVTMHPDEPVLPSYPTSLDDRKAFRTNTGKKLTTHQWEVYDFVFTIPSGKVSTYKSVSAAVGGSPRSVGNALRNNPFAPYIPCHRVIASNNFVGGFFGEWGPNHKTGTRCNQKLQLLTAEGVSFDKNGHLRDMDAIWKGQECS